MRWPLAGPSSPTRTCRSASLWGHPSTKLIRRPTTARGRWVIRIIRLWWGDWYLLAFLLPLIAPALDSWVRNTRATGDFSHDLPVWWAHTLKDFFPHSGAVSCFYGLRLGPLLDGSNRVVNFADAGCYSDCFVIDLNASMTIRRIRVK
jgi:hypothetical protein